MLIAKSYVEKNQGLEGEAFKRILNEELRSGKENFRYGNQQR